MAKIIFFGKLNCIENKHQRTLLQAAGHTVENRNILKQKWTPERLRRFFKDLPLREWFDTTAPAIMTRQFSIDSLSTKAALEAMIRDPLLIRRPLMDIDGYKVCGFHYLIVDAMIGLTPRPKREDPMARSQNACLTINPLRDATPIRCQAQERLWPGSFH